jgi:hypothetical protein
MALTKTNDDATSSDRFMKHSLTVLSHVSAEAGRGLALLCWKREE